MKFLYLFRLFCPRLSENLSIDFRILYLHEAAVAFKGKKKRTMLWKCVKYFLTQHSHIKRGLDSTQ